MLRLPLQRWSVPLYSVMIVAVIAIVSLPSFRSHNSYKKTPQITVAEVLSKAESGEQAGIRQAKQPVIYQRVQIRVGSKSYSRSIYRDTRDARHVDKLESIAGLRLGKDAATALDPVEHAFTEAKLDWQAPLSPSRLSGWRSALRVRADQVRSDQAVTEIATSTPAGPIAEARVTFRNADFHPISETLRLRDNKVVEIAELDYKVLELNQLNADFFDSTAAPILALRASGSGSSQADLRGVALELEVMARLDRVNALMGEQITVDRHRDVVHVRGVVDNKQRRDEILTAMGLAAKQPELQLDLVVPDGIRPALKGGTRPVIEGIEGFERAPADGSLREFFAKKPNSGTTPEDEVQRFTDEVSLHSQSARANAIALKQIAERFSPEDLSEMTADEHREWRHMLQAHANAVLKETRSMRENLEPIFRSSAEDKQAHFSNLKDDADLVDAAARLSDLAASNDSAVWHSFAASTEASNVTLVCLPEFWESLSDAEILAQEISESTKSENQVSRTSLHNQP
jgi:hypothetical protein